MSPETVVQLTEPIAKYYSPISPATSAALPSYLPTRTAFLLWSLSITMSILIFSISFTLFRRHWQRLFTNPQRFFWVTFGRFINLVESITAEYDLTNSTFLYLTDAEFPPDFGSSRNHSSS